MPFDSNLSKIFHLLDWYSRSVQGLPAAFLSSSFIFDDNGVAMSAGDLISTVEAFAGFSEMEHIVSTQYDNSASLLFDATDSATGIKYRTAWFATFDAEGVVMHLYSLCTKML
jgi:hypothetical protein